MFWDFLFYGIIAVGAILFVSLTIYRIDWARHPEKYKDIAGDEDPQKAEYRKKKEADKKAAARTGSFIRSRRAACPPTPFTRKRSSSLEAMYFPRRKPNVPVLSMGSTCCPTNAATRYPSNGRSRITSEAPPGFSSSPGWKSPNTVPQKRSR